MSTLSNRNLLIIAGLVCGVIASALAYYGNPGNMAICAACFIRDIAGALKLHSAVVVQYARPEIVGIVLGAFLLSIGRKEFDSKGGSSPALKFFFGFAMMIGALVFLGCPLRMIIRMAGGDLNSYIGLIGFIAGIATGSVALKRGFDLGRSHETTTASGLVMPVIMVIILLLAVGTNLLAASVKGPGSMHAPILISLVAGLIFGAIALNARFCFSGAFRNMFLTKNFDLMLGIATIFVVLLVFNLATDRFKLSFDNQPIAHTEHLWNILGLYVVGLAGVLASGCPLRQLTLAGKGSSDASFAVIGMLVGGAIAHNFSLAASPAGVPEYGKIVCVALIIILLLIAFMVKGKKTVV